MVSPLPANEMKFSAKPPIVGLPTPIQGFASPTTPGKQKTRRGWTDSSRKQVTYQKLEVRLEHIFVAQWRGSRGLDQGKYLEWEISYILHSSNQQCIAYNRRRSFQQETFVMWLGWKDPHNYIPLLKSASGKKVRTFLEAFQYSLSNYFHFRELIHKIIIGHCAYQSNRRYQEASQAYYRS